MAVCPDRILFPASFRMSEKERTVKNAGMLGKCQRVALTVWRVGEQVERGTGKPEWADITTGLVVQRVLGFTLG